NKSSQTVFDAVCALQTASRTPLWFVADFEAGTGARIYDGTTFPMNMAHGAADDTALAVQCGRITAREARSMGVQIGFGPVVDVNTEPFNPIISTRSYSDDPERVTRLAKAFVAGARAEGMLCTLKHYPGHGGTTGDSHNELPIVNLSYEELMNIHIKPYANLLQDTTVPIDFIMTAHVWYPAFDPGSTAWPATLSTTAIYNILRNQLGYKGIVITDAFGMTGLQNAAPTPQATIYAIKAGVDIILMPPNTIDVCTSLYSAVTTGEISLSRIDESVRRILMAKSMVGLPAEAYPQQWILDSTIHHPDHLTTARQVAQESLTFVGDRANAIPVDTTDRVLCLIMTPTKTIFYNKSNTYFINALRTHLPTISVKTISSSISISERNQIVSDAATNYDKVILASYDFCYVNSSNQQALVRDLCQIATPLIYVSFGSPYPLIQFQQVDAFLCGYCSQEDEQEFAADAICGTFSPTGILPVNIYWTNVETQFWRVFQ
ncbi:MAG: glycoside hydrolase family 3 N-terminal domain-containing protein, partial [bacterium]|nr:glycoside hydrolase family 3 N-terminal domain-containing protein [bacterium]